MSGQFGIRSVSHGNAATPACGDGDSTFSKDVQTVVNGEISDCLHSPVVCVATTVGPGLLLKIARGARIFGLIAHGGEEIASADAAVEATGPSGETGAGAGGSSSAVPRPVPAGPGAMLSGGAAGEEGFAATEGPHYLHRGVSSESPAFTNAQAGVAASPHRWLPIMGGPRLAAARRALVQSSRRMNV